MYPLKYLKRKLFDAKIQDHNKTQDQSYQIMGDWEKKNLVLQLYTKRDFSDPRLVEIIGQNREYTTKEFDEMVNRIPNRWNNYAERIIRFFDTYQDGILRPDRYDWADPIRKIYHEEEIPSYVEHLSFPAAGFYIKKFKGLTYNGSIENEQVSASWEEDKAHGIPKHRCIPRLYPIVKARILLLFDTRRVAVRRQPLSFWLELFEQIKEIIEAYKGYIKNDETGEVLYQFGPLQKGDIW